jgi:hypothetical protein
MSSIFKLAPPPPLEGHAQCAMQVDLMNVAHMPTRSDEELVNLDAGALFRCHGGAVTVARF